VPRAPRGRRRIAAIAAGGLALLVAAVALVAGGDGDEPPAPAPRLPAPELSRSFTDPALGVAVRRPAGWSAARRRGAIRLASARRDVLVAISAPGPARDARRLLEEAVGALVASLEDARVVGEPQRASLAGLRGTTRVVAGRNASGTQVRVLASALRGRRRAYVVEVFAAESAPAGRLAEAQAILGSLRLGR
jgi:hypothetical protein